MDQSNKYKHLSMIEKIIERMSRNCFTLKGWALTLVVLTGSFSAVGSNQLYILIAFIPIICFWLLDSYYLQQERKYRILYRNTLEKKEEEIDFNLDNKEIKATASDREKIRFSSCLFSFSEAIFYGPITLIIIILMIILL